MGTTFRTIRSPTRYGAAWIAIMAIRTSAFRHTPANRIGCWCDLTKSASRSMRGCSPLGLVPAGGTEESSDMPHRLSLSPEDSYAEQRRADKKEHQRGPQHASHAGEEI